MCKSGSAKPVNEGKSGGNAAYEEGRHGPSFVDNES